MDDKILCVSVVGDGISLKGGFSKGNSPHRSLYVEDIYEIIEKLFKIQNPAAELGVLQKSDRHAKGWNIAAKNADIHYRLNLDSFVGGTYKLSTGVIVGVNRKFENFTNIVVKDVPPHWGPDIVKRIISAYGIVREINAEPFSSVFQIVKQHIEKCGTVTGE